MNTAAHNRLSALIGSPVETSFVVASLPSDEAAMLEALHQFQILDTAPEEVFDDITQLAALICSTPVALISLVDTNRQWFKSKFGLEVSQTPRDLAFCAHAILQTDVFIVADTRADDRFAAHPLVVSEPHIRFYAGVPLVTSDRHAIGTLCVIDYIPRELSLEQLEALKSLAHQVVKLLELRRQITKLEYPQLQRQPSGKKSKKFFKKVAIGFGLASATLVAVGFVAYRSLNSLVESANLQLQNYQVLEEVKDIRSYVQQATLAEHRYITTGSRHYLEPYYNATKAIEQEISRLWQLIEHHPKQQHHLATLEFLVTEKFAEIEEITKLRQAKGLEAVLNPLLLQKAITLTDHIDATLREMEKVENQLLAQESRAAQIKSRKTVLAFSSGIVLSFLILAAVYYLIHREIEERQRVETVLEQERDFTFAVLDTVASLVLVIDAEGKIVRFNRACEYLTGYWFNEVKDKYFWDWFLLPEEVEPVKAAFYQIVSGDFPNQYENHWVTRSGEQRLIAWLNTALCDRAGTVEYVIASGIDITERASAAAALRSSEQHLRNVLNSLFTFVAVIAPDGTLVEVNQAFLASAALKAEDVVGKPLVETYWWSYSSKMQAQLEAAIGHVSLGEKVRCEFEARIDEMQFITVDFSLSPMFNAAGQVSYLIASAIDITERKQAEAARQQVNEQLSNRVNELKQRNREITLLNEISDILQACLTTEEAYKAIAAMMPSLFPETTGGLFLINSAKNLVEPMITWGSLPLQHQQAFIPADCWALRRGQLHWVENTDNGLICQHLHHDCLPTAYLCLPMMGQGEALGVLYLGAEAERKLTVAQQQLAVTVAEHIGLALANIKLRETLQNQSIRDPLTGLFNRRYMEESLAREIYRCDRKQQSLSIVMLDVDHFKCFNDVFGHEAGDLVLKQLGKFLQRHVRGSDIACRYGGEEFTLILPEAALTVTQQRAEKIRQGIKHLNVDCCQQQIGNVTLSLGVACFPQHGLTPQAVLRSADAALYRAKKEGRDRVVTASGE